PTCDNRSRSARSSSRSAPISFASWSTGTPSGCFATYGTMNNSRRSRWATSRDTFDLQRIARGDHCQLAGDPRAQLVTAQHLDRTLRGEHARCRELRVRAVERDQRALSPGMELTGFRPVGGDDALDRGRSEVFV